MDASATAVAQPQPAHSAPAWPQAIAVLIPVYNHARTVCAVAEALRELGASVLVVDDGSTDHSGTSASAAGFEVITLPQNQGKAAALRAGMEALAERGHQQVLTIDADGQHPTAEALKLALAASEGPRALHIGCRDMRGKPFISRLGRFLSNSWSWLACGTWLGDSQSGLRVYPLPHTTRLDAPADRYAFEIEVLVRAAWAGIAVHRVEVSVLYPEDRVSHFNKFADNIRGGLVLSRLCLRRLWPFGKRPALEDSSSARPATSHGE